MAACPPKWRTSSNSRAVLLDTLTDEELRDFELEENLNRKDLTVQEYAKTYRLSKKDVEKAQKAGKTKSSPGEEKDPRGRKATYAVPKDQIVKELGMSVGALVKAEQHVTLAERFPFMQKDRWRQSDVLRVGEHLDATPKAEHEQVAGVTVSR